MLECHLDEALEFIAIQIIREMLNLFSLVVTVFGFTQVALEFEVLKQ